MRATLRHRLLAAALACTILSAPGSSLAQASSSGPPHDAFYWVSEENKASIIMLAEAGIVPKDLASAIAKAVVAVTADGNKPGAKRSGDYLEVEKSMIAISGPDVTRIHSGRSRQDMGATSARTTQRDAFLAAYEQFINARAAILTMAMQHPNAILPFYTHSVQAQPTSLGHYLGGYLQAYSRESDRYQQAWARLNLSTFGSAAGGTSSFPVNRARLAELMGFDGIMENSFDGGQISMQDTGSELVGVAASTALTTSMLMADLLTQYGNPYPWFYLKEGDQTGISSIMPQKRNPTGIERLQQTVGTVSGMAMTYYIQSENVPSGLGAYKGQTPAQTLRAAGGMYGDVTAMLGALEFFPERALERVNEDYSMTTELADVLQREANVPFRVGHHFASEMVNYGRANQLRPSQIPYKEAQRIFAKAAADFKVPTKLPLTEARFREALTAENMVNSAKPVGGPQPAEVARMLANEKARLDKDRAWLDAKRAQLRKAADERNAGVAALIAGN